MGEVEVQRQIEESDQGWEGEGYVYLQADNLHHELCSPLMPLAVFHKRCLHTSTPLSLYYFLDDLGPL